MPTYKCTYRDEHGKLVTDSKTAPDKNVIQNEFRRKNYHPISIEDISSAPRRSAAYLFFSRKKELAVFTRQLSNLLSSGMELSRALELLGKHSRHPAMRSMVLQVKDRVSGGGHFWEALAMFPQIFPSLYIGMVKAGETGGHLEKVIENLADFTEEQKEMHDTLVSMAVYPVFLFVIGTATLLFIMGFVFPRMLFIFDSVQGKPLPAATQWLIGISSFLSSNGLILAVGAVCAVAVVFQLRKDPAVRLGWHAWIYRSPVIGAMIQKMIFARFTQMLGLVLSNGVTMVNALEISQGVVDNAYVARRLSGVRRNVFQGKSLSGSLRQADIFSPLMVHIISVGEESGTLDNILTKISKNYEREVKEEMKQFMSLLEPAIILVVALGVGFIVAAILLPIFQMNLSGL